MLWIILVSQLALVPPVTGLHAGGAADVVKVSDARTLELADGRTLRLSGIDSPETTSAAALKAVREMAEGRSVSLFFGEARTDRWRRTVAHAVLADGTWIQAALLRRGLARVYSFADNRLGVPEMLAIEAEAREAGRGLWANWKTDVKTPAETPRLLNSFQVVKGSVLDAANVRGRIYLNFGADWKTDFTILVPPKIRRQFERNEIDLAALPGNTVQVRGWVKRWNGPMIELTHAEQLEILHGHNTP